MSYTLPILPADVREVSRAENTTDSVHRVEARAQGGEQARDVLVDIFLPQCKLQLLQNGNDRNQSIECSLVGHDVTYTLLPVGNMNEKKGTYAVDLIIYRIMQHTGSGNMNDTNRRILGKVIRDNDNEVHAVRVLSHLTPSCGVVPAKLLEYGEGLYLNLMPHMDGTTEDPGFEFFITQASPSQRVGYLRDIILAVVAQLQCLMQHSLYYTDLKPSNILYRLDDSNKLSVMLGDLGSCYDPTHTSEPIATLPCDTVKPWNNNRQFVHECVLKHISYYCIFMFMRYYHGHSVAYDQGLTRIMNRYDVFSQISENIQAVMPDVASLLRSPSIAHHDQLWYDLFDPRQQNGLEVNDTDRNLNNPPTILITPKVDEKYSIYARYSLVPAHRTTYHKMTRVYMYQIDQVPTCRFEVHIVPRSSRAFRMAPLLQDGRRPFRVVPLDPHEYNVGVYIKPTGMTLGSSKFNAWIHGRPAVEVGVALKHIMHEIRSQASSDTQTYGVVRRVIGPEDVWLIPTLSFTGDMDDLQVYLLGPEKMYHIREMRMWVDEALDLQEEELDSLKTYLDHQYLKKQKGPKPLTRKKADG